MGLSRGKRFAFENFGGSYQLRIRSADDLAALEELDAPFWIATSAPIAHFTCDASLLQRMDTDGNGRLNSDEVRAAIRRLLSALRNTEGVTEGRDHLSLDDLDTSHDEGRRLHATARRVLDNLCGGTSDRLTLAQVRDQRAIFARGDRNGDGVIPPESIGDGQLRAFARDVMATTGSVTDRNGSEGVSVELLDKFLANARALLAWHADSQADRHGPDVFPLGDATAAAYEKLGALRGAIDAFFTQCDIVALNDTQGRTALAPSCPAEVFTDESEARAYLASAPLARPNAEGRLPLGEGTNPYFRPALEEIAARVLRPLLGTEDLAALTHEQWDRVKGAFTAYKGWLESKKGGEVEKLGPEKLAVWVEGDFTERMRALIAADLAAGGELAALNDLEYLILLQSHAIRFCNNFVSFPYLYDPSTHATFEEGRLVMDGRVFNLSVRVENAEAHSAVAARSGIYLLYSEVTGPAGSQPFHMVTPVTSGRVGDLGVGKRGVLFTPDGRQLDVRVVKVVENAVSLREALLAPFQRLAALVTSTAERIGVTMEQQVEGQVAQTTASLETGLTEGVAAPRSAEAQAAPGAQPAPRPAGGRNMRDMLLTGGVAVAALGSSFAYILKTFADLQWQQLAWGLALALTALLVPLLILAWLKLRRRNLSAILEASGWAINARMRLTGRLGNLLTFRPAHPKSFRRLRRDVLRVFRVAEPGPGVWKARGKQRP